ncbi:hypothetical protein LTS17_008367 [Exophiala oligosperma]
MTSITCQNDADPLFLPITYNNLSSDGLGASAWGIALDVGTPNQTFSLYPSILEITVLANTRHCTSKDDLACVATNGGLYDPRLSSTSVNQDLTTWNGTSAGMDSSIFIFYDDVVDVPQLNDTTIWGYPFVTDDGSLWGVSSLGIGPNSSFLQAAVDVGAAPSMSWGLCVGSRSIDEPQDGLLMVGAYDDARVAGDFFTDTSTPDCPVCLQIQDLSWVTNAGTVPLTNASTSNFQVSPNPISSSIEIPQESFAAFGAATNGTYDPTLETYTYPPSNPPAGNLSFTIKGGYKTSIPADELFRFPRQYDGDGELVIANDTYQRAFVYSYTNQDTSAAHYAYTWGLPFLTMNSLVLDVERQQFRLSEAIRQNFGSEGGVFPRKLYSGSSAVGTDEDKSGRGNGAPVGAIVGGVVGGVAGLTAIVVLVFYLWRRLRRRSLKNVTRQVQTTTGGAAPAAGYHDPHLSMCPSHPSQGSAAASYPPVSGYHLPAGGHTPSSFGHGQQQQQQPTYHYTETARTAAIIQELPSSSEKPNGSSGRKVGGFRSQRARSSSDIGGSVSTF